jgi:AcrR family transcriptional regulator
MRTAPTREDRRNRTRAELIEVAERRFSADGYHATSLDAVADEAGFTKGAVYSNFKSKDDLFLALFDDRIERQFAVTIEVLEDGSHDMTEQLPRVRELLHGGAFFWDDSWTTLYLEFVLYAMRNPEARAKLAARAVRERTAVKELMEREYSNVGAAAEHSTRELAEISLALFNGLGMARLIDPDAVTNDTLDVALELLYESMGVDTEQ